MKREIKFRMWSGILKYMYYPELTERNLWNIPSSENGIIQNNELKRIDPRNELMQFTGLLDKKEKEIYEYDILKCEYGIGKVIFNAGCWMVCWIDDKEASMEFVFSRKGRYRRNENDADEFEIIGNVFENPELVCDVV